MMTEEFGDKEMYFSMIDLHDPVSQYQCTIGC